ncbi:hypothetical protein [Streptomyces sp. NPDC059009]|uniref:hypothetical protein n=1 Tax=Streptomyces sp. NPDC059009 TaxID=3346694 RepID=UPI0036AABA6D
MPAEPAAPMPAEPAVPTPEPPSLGRGTRLALPVALAVLALPLITAAHLSRPAPYGDHLTVHARVAAESEPGLRTGSRSVEAYDPGTGLARWTYTRAGHRPLSLLPAPGHAIALWDDGLITDTERTGAAVRWHRAVPATAPWLRTPAARGAAGVLQPLDPDARMLAVVTPQRIAAYRTADGDLRWTLPARRGCAFEPARAARHRGALLVAQPCGDGTAPWTSQLVAVDGLGRIAPHRTPLGNALPGGPGAWRGGPEKVVAPPR